MKVIVFGTEQEKVLDLIADAGITVVEENPDFIVSFGGDGTVIRSETKYPEIPKIILKNSAICKLCSKLENQEVLERVKSGNYTIEEYLKLSVTVNDETRSALNDITIHNADPRHGLRYHVWVNGKQVGKDIIGDGVVISTPFGSTAYYRSITDSFFELGIGLAFNNSTEQSDHMVIREDSIVELEIERGPALVYVDTQEAIHLNKGDRIQVKKSATLAKIVRVGV